MFSSLQVGCLVHRLLHGRASRKPESADDSELASRRRNGVSTQLNHAWLINSCCRQSTALCAPKLPILRRIAQHRLQCNYRIQASLQLYDTNTVSTIDQLQQQQCKAKERPWLASATTLLTSGCTIVGHNFDLSSNQFDTSQVQTFVASKRGFRK